VTASGLCAAFLLVPLVSLHAAEVTLPESYKSDGENLIAAFKGESIRRTRPIFWEWRGGGADPDFWLRLAVRDGDWKLTLTSDGSRTELYQLTNDRAEAKDVAKDHPEIIARLTKLAQDWKATLPDKPDLSCISTAARDKEKSKSKNHSSTTTP
jgi:hypothetical protein